MEHSSEQVSDMQKADRLKEEANECFKSITIKQYYAL